MRAPYSWYGKRRAEFLYHRLRVFTGVILNASGYVRSPEVKNFGVEQLAAVRYDLNMMKWQMDHTIYELRGLLDAEEMLKLKGLL